jgi:hypothetical protein
MIVITDVFCVLNVCRCMFPNDNFHDNAGLQGPLEPEISCIIKLKQSNLCIGPLKNEFLLCNNQKLVISSTKTLSILEF